VSVCAMLCVILFELPLAAGHIQMMWTIDPIIRAIILSPRIGNIVSRLLGCNSVRLYHDNCLSRAPGSKRTLWHCDDGPNGYMAVGGPNVVTVWFPLHICAPSMGSLVFPKAPDTCDGQAARSLNAFDVAHHAQAVGLDEKSDEYDRLCATALEQSGALPDETTYEIGDLSVHATDCFHCAGPNLTETPRMILAATYFPDESTMRTDMGPIESLPRGQQNDWKKFAPGVVPGMKLASKFNPIVPPLIDNERTSPRTR